MQTDQDMVAYYFKNEIFILRTLNEFFLKKIDFQRDLLRKVFYFKIKEINLKTTKYKKQAK